MHTFENALPLFPCIHNVIAWFSYNLSYRTFTCIGTLVFNNVMLHKVSKYNNLLTSHLCSATWLSKVHIEHLHFGSSSDLVSAPPRDEVSVDNVSVIEGFDAENIKMKRVGRYKTLYLN